MPRTTRDTRRVKINQAIRACLAGLSKDELVKRLYEAAQENDDLWAELQEECRFEPTADSAKELIEWSRRAIHAATQPGLEWGGDYDAVAKYLRKLLDKGHPDAVLDLGVQLHEAANRQVEMSDEALMHDDVEKC